MDSDSEITLIVPARPEHISVIRAVLGVAAARSDFTYEGVDDLRLAVDEACSQLLTTASPTDRLEVRIATRGRVIEVSIATGSGTPGWPADDVKSGMAWDVMGALVEEVDAGSSDGRTWITLVKPSTVTD